MFSPPPFDLPLEYALDFHLRENPEHVMIVHPTSIPGEAISCTFAEFVPAVHRAGHHVIASISPAQGSSRVVAIVLKTSSIMYLTVIAGLLRAGLIPFPIFERYPMTTIAHLLKESLAMAVVVDESTRADVTKVLADFTDRPSLCTLPELSTLFPGNRMFTPLPTHERKPGDVSLVLHSSSSGAVFPKLCPWTSETITHHGEIKDLPPQHVVGRTLGLYGAFFFHAYAISLFFTMIRRGLVLGLMDPTNATLFSPSPDDIYRGFESGKPEWILVAPMVLEKWAEDDKKVEGMRESGVTFYFGGRPLNKDIGDKLIRHGVKICSVYGSTEVGPVMIMPHFQGRDDWEYFTIYPRPDVNFIQSSHGDERLYELIVAPCEEQSYYLARSNCAWEGRPAYNPGDLFLAHPTKPSTFKLFGRLDDQIILASGLKINPLTPEDKLSRHPLIRFAIMFGSFRPCAGLIIEPEESSLGQISVESFLETIWPLIQAYNDRCDAHAHIAKHMVILADPAKPFSINPKGTPRRQVIIRQYQDEIDHLYSRYMNPVN